MWVYSGRLLAMISLLYENLTRAEAGELLSAKQNSIKLNRLCAEIEDLINEKGLTDPLVEDVLNHIKNIYDKFFP